ncbi:MAG: hypothetical protein ACK4ND_12635 [Cytophagaceae bacterium]
MKNVFLRNFVFAILGLIVLVSCKKDEDDVTNPGHDHSHHLITTLKIYFKAEGEEPLEFVFRDPKGDGNIEKDRIVLAANKSYESYIELLNESDADNIEVVTGDIRKEDDEHQAFYIISDGLQLEHTYEDEDEYGKPVGLSNSFVTGDAGLGTIKVILKEYHRRSDKGNINRGHTEIEAEFDVTIE